MPIRHNLVLCTLRHSDNLGDGIIADCMAYLLSKLRLQRALYQIDLSGRLSVEPLQNSRTRSQTKSLFHSLPLWLQSTVFTIVWHTVMKPKVSRNWLEILPDGPLDVIIGGGQVLSDVGLNFPWKVNLLARLLTQRGGRLIFSGVGCGQKISITGKWLFARVLTAPFTKGVTLRDEWSLQAYRKHFPELDLPVLSPDPALFVQQAYGISASHLPKDGRLRVGLGVAAPNEIASQSLNRRDFTYQHVLSFWLEIANRVAVMGWEPVFFTNGAAEDEAFLDAVVAHLQQNASVRRLPRPTSPRGLVLSIADFNAVVAHRLHANIVAFALGIPAVALVWDAKILGFASLAERNAYAISSSQLNADYVSEMLLKCWHDPPSPQRLLFLQNEIEIKLDGLLRQAGM